MPYTSQVRALLRAIHIPGTCVQFSSETTVYGHEDGSMEALYRQYEGSSNLYFLANVPMENKQATPYKRNTKDLHITQRKYTVFDIDLRKLFEGELSLLQEQLMKEAIESITQKLLDHDIFSTFRAIVHSGNGIHIYYTSAEPVPCTYYSQGYKRIAGQLSSAIGYEVDPACSNPSRIIRLPGSYNQKRQEKPLVSLLVYQEKDSPLLAQMTEAPKRDAMLFRDFLELIQREPILNLCSFFHIPTSSDHYVLEPDGKKSSIRLNTETNLVRRFSDKPGTGNFVHLYSALHNLTFLEASEKIASAYYHTSLTSTPHDHRASLAEDVRAHRASTYTSTYTPLSWNTPTMDATFPVIHAYSYVVLAGETKSGKSTVAFDMAVKNAKAGHQVIYLTLEMSADQLRHNVGRQAAGIEPLDERHAIQHGSYPGSKETIFRAKVSELEALTNLVIIGKTFGKKMAIEDIHDLLLDYPDASCVIIDNLDKIDRSEGCKDDFEKQKHVSHFLLEMTTAYNLPVILVHHLKKAQESHAQSLFRSTNALSGTGKISHDADLVVFVARAKDHERGTFKDNQTFIRVMETREFSPTMHRLYFYDGSFHDDDPRYPTPYTHYYD